MAAPPSDDPENRLWATDAVSSSRIMPDPTDSGDMGKDLASS